MIPSAFATLLLSVAAWRTFHLLAFDDILNAPRNILAGLPSNWKQGDPKQKYREGFQDFLECPFCFGFWIALGWWGAWAIWPHWTLVASIPFVLSAGLVAAQKYLTSDN